MLRDYQALLKRDTYQAWGTNKRILAVMPTGAGKTVFFSDIAKDYGQAIAIAHRQELVGQMSVTFARNEIKHRLFAPPAVVKEIVKLQMMDTGRNWVDPNAAAAVAGVGTLNGKKLQSDHYFQQYKKTVKLWIQDEAHHCLPENQWGRAIEMFPGALGLGVTATPERADGKALSGIFDAMVEGPQMRTLINRGFLTDYKIFAPPSDLDMTGVPIGSSGDFSQQETKKRVKNSHIIGDVVKHYLKIAPGKLGVTFATDIETAGDIARQFNAAGVKAEVVTADTPALERALILAKFKTRQILMLVNVDLFGEGFDLPAIEVVIMARPTASYGLFVQQFGRVLRLMLDPAIAAHWDSYSDTQRRQLIAASKKPFGIIIDHVKNINVDGNGRHSLPDCPRTWSLEGRKKAPRQMDLEGEIPLRTCPMCTATYFKLLSACPECGYTRQITNRSAPEFVDGDLSEIDPAVLAKMRGEIVNVEMDINVYREDLRGRLSPEYIETHVRHQMGRVDAQKALRDSVAIWAGYHRAKGRNDSEIYKRFYWQFGTDMVTAFTLNRADAEKLRILVDTVTNSGT